MPKGGRTSTAIEVRARRDKWLAAMLQNVRDTLAVQPRSKKCVAEMLLTENQDGLTKRITPKIQYFIFHLVVIFC
jgi:phenylacetate 2-hydroxylase